MNNLEFHSLKDNKLKLYSKNMKHLKKIFKCKDKFLQ